MFTYGGALFFADIWLCVMRKRGTLFLLHTKKKQSVLSPETVDYFLNKIYVPYFGISYRNQRKISIDVELLDQLFSGNEATAKKAMKKFFREDKDDVGNGQLSLFDLN